MNYKISRRKSLVLAATGMVAAATTIAKPARVFAIPKKTYDLEPIKIDDGVWMIEGKTEHFSTENGGAIVNCVLIESDQGMIIVDTGPCRRYGEALRTVAGEISGRGIAACINTHQHPDHFFGNQVFADKPIFALPQVTKLIEAMADSYSDNMYRLLGDWMRGTEAAAPNKAIETSTLKIGGREFQMLPLAGHTKADLALVDTKTGIIIAGDLAFFDRAPTTPDADIKTWQTSIAALQSINAKGIIGGHGRFDTTGESLKQTSSYLNWLNTTLKNAAVAGYNMVEIMDLPIPEEFAKMGAMPDEFYRSISHLYPALEREAMPMVRAGGE